GAKRASHSCRLLLRSGGPRLYSCRWCNRAGHRESSMFGFYRAVAKQRAYLQRAIGSAAREKASRRWWQIPSRFARTEPARDEGREHESPRFKFHVSPAFPSFPFRSTRVVDIMLTL